MLSINPIVGDGQNALPVEMGIGYMNQIRRNTDDGSWANGEILKGWLSVWAGWRYHTSCEALEIAARKFHP